MANETKISCPNCGQTIDVNNVIAHQLEEEFKKKYNNLILEDRKKQKEERDQIDKLKQELLLEKENQDKIFHERLNQQLKSEKEKIEKELKSAIDKEQSEQIALIQKELADKSEQLKEYYKTQAELEKTKREKEELKEKIEADAEKKLNEQIKLEKEKIAKQEQEKNEMKILELQKQIEDQKKQAEEMKRKLDQGSMQLQGEVQELAIEDWLRSNFPLDTINEVKKGDRGADCVQIVHTRTKQNCGSICYESKRTKEFNMNWIEKFKDDIRDKNATIGVLVTDVYPKGKSRMDLIDGIWVCSYDEFKGLCIVLRESIIQLSNLTSSQENKGEKMVMLYDFLISNEFRMQVEGIVEGFTQMQSDLISEMRSMQGHWKKREKQIQKVLLNTNHMYNSIKGIAGNAIQPISTLELPEVEDED
jgi:hypothetical protein